MSSTMHNQDAVTFHDDVAEVWEGYYQSKTFKARLDVLATLLPDSLVGQNWLDAGCGTGTLGRWLAMKRGASVLAIDGAANMLSHALPARGVEYRQGDILKTGLPSGKFDGIVCSSVLEFLPEPTMALQELRRLLKPGGQLLVSVPNRVPAVRIPLLFIYWVTRPLGRWRRYAYLDHSKHSYTAIEFREALTRAGFHTDQILHYGDLGLPMGIRFSGSGSLLMARTRKPF